MKGNAQKLVKTLAGKITGNFVWVNILDATRFPDLFWIDMIIIPGEGRKICFYRSCKLLAESEESRNLSPVATPENLLRLGLPPTVRI